MQGESLIDDYLGGGVEALLRTEFIWRSRSCALGKS